MEPVSKASFGLNETLRIIIPGYYLLALAFLYLGVLDVRLSTIAESFPSIMIGLALGFILYSWNYPNRRTAYKQGQPSDYLLERSRNLAASRARPEIELKSDEQIRLYFYILNNFVPQTFHEVVLGRGALYYCVTYVWLISGILAGVGFLTLLLTGIAHLITGVPGCWLTHETTLTLDPQRLCLLLIYSVGQILIWLMLRYPNRTDRMLTYVYKDQIEWLKLNDPLVEYLLVNRCDPRVYTFLQASTGRK